MNVKCKWCKEENSEGVPVDPYMVKVDAKPEFVYGCFECIQENTVYEDRMPVLLPDGFEIVPGNTLKEHKQFHEALMAVNVEMEKSQGISHSDTWYPYPAARLGDLINGLKSTIQHHAEFRARLGLDAAVAEAMLSGAYCPSCKGPLIKMIGLKQRFALQCASSKLVKMMEPTREKRNRQVLCCFQCQTAYIGDKTHD